MSAWADQYDLPAGVARDIAGHISYDIPVGEANEWLAMQADQNRQAFNFAAAFMTRGVSSSMTVDFWMRCIELNAVVVPVMHYGGYRNGNTDERDLIGLRFLALDSDPVTVEQDDPWFMLDDQTTCAPSETPEAALLALEEARAKHEEKRKKREAEWRKQNSWSKP